MIKTRYAVTVQGLVQCVGFRHFTLRLAQRHDVTGWVANHPDGSVRIEVEGDAASVAAFLAAVQKGPLGAEVDRFERAEIPVVNDREFQVVSWG